jgi:hypothetical protein
MGNSGWLGPPLSSPLLNMKSDDVEHGLALTYEVSWSQWSCAARLLPKLILCIKTRCFCPSLRTLSCQLWQIATLNSVPLYGPWLVSLFQWVLHFLHSTVNELSLAHPGSPYNPCLNMSHYMGCVLFYVCYIQYVWIYFIRTDWGRQGSKKLTKII